MAALLAGCANVDLGESGGWFQKPLDLFGKKGGYTYSELGEARKQQRPVTPNDLVDVGGACPAQAATQAAAPVSPAAAPAGGPPAGPDSQIGGGVALGMTECEVVFRAGPPNLVQLGKNPNGDRTAVLTYNSGPRPGVYHFERGQLMAMDRVAEAPPQKPVAKNTKKKSVKPDRQAAKD